jgi:hypothetical protein
MCNVPVGHAGDALSLDVSLLGTLGPNASLTAANFYKCELLKQLDCIQSQVRTAPADVEMPRQDVLDALKAAALLISSVYFPGSGWMLSR